MLYGTDFEVDCIRERLIKEKEEQIRVLEEELKELKNPRTLKGLVDRDIYYVSPFKNDDFRIKKLKNWSGWKEWEYIRLICTYLWKPMHKGESIKVGKLSKEELEISARMAEEVIDIWNKYIVNVYKDMEVEQ